jgi:hypothetical protein
MAKKEETVTGQVKRQLFFNSSGIVYMEFIPEGATVNKHHYKRSFVIYTVQFIVSILSFSRGRTGCCYMTAPLHIALCLSKRSWQNNRSPFCHTFHTHLISHYVISFPFSS